MMKKKEHLPLFGVGPIYVYTIAMITLIAFLCRNLSVFEVGRLTNIKAILIILGSVLVMIGAGMWIMAVIVSKLDDNIKS